jgi:hypothetical protein
MKKLIGLMALVGLMLGCSDPLPPTSRQCIESWYPVKDSNSPVSRCLTLTCGVGKTQTMTTLVCEEKK